VRQPVRAGQIVYAEANDLIVLAPVNPGAQLLADGNIHVYAPLRGRAVAGVRGAREARIFCQRLEAELVGIDAAYVTAEDIAPELVGKPAQVSLEDGRCVIRPL
jgi:septum site-determining protein MinC